MLRKLAVLAVLAVAGYGAESSDYDAVRQGQFPPGWSAVSGNKWEVRADDSAPSHPNVLLSPAALSEGEPPIALFDKVVCKDGDLSVKFRIDGSHKADAAVGVVWRYQDAANFYLLSMNDEGNVVLHRMRNGVSEVVSSGGREEIRPGQWHLVKVAFKGPRIQVFFGNRRLFTANDAGLPVPGRTGLWVRGKHVAAFDDFRIDKKG